MVQSGISSTVEAMSAQVRRLDAITANLANVSTPGYKRRTTTVQSFEVGHRNGPKVEQPVATSSVDFRQGLLQQTGNTFDLALSGEGWFVVEGAEGEMLTRGGSFHLGQDGTLLDPDGNPVAWQGGRARIEPNAAAVSIDGRGQVFQDGVNVGQLRVVDIPASDQLQPLDHGYWRAAPELEQLPSDAEVHQGAIENSNANAVDELIELVRVQRQFESAANLMTTLDRTYQRLNRGR